MLDVRGPSPRGDDLTLGRTSAALPRLRGGGPDPRRHGDCGRADHAFWQPRRPTTRTPRKDGGEPESTGGRRSGVRDPRRLSAVAKIVQRSIVDRRNLREPGPLPRTAKRRPQRRIRTPSRIGPSRCRHEPGFCGLLAGALGSSEGLSPEVASAYTALSVTPRHWQTWLDEGKGMPESLAQAGAVKSFGAMPLIVLSRGLTVDPDQDWQRMQNRATGSVIKQPTTLRGEERTQHRVRPTRGRRRGDRECGRADS
jgi:hypothetical protein